MKLGDVLPHWIFRERAGIDVEVGGTGGSAFAHLAEDAGNSRLDIDWPLWIHPTADDASGVDIEPVGFIGFYPAAPRAVFESSLSTDANPRFQVGHDGQLHWGGGPGAPDVKLYRKDPGLLASDSDLLFGTDADIEEWWNGGGEGQVTRIAAGYITLDQSAAGSPAFTVSVVGEANRRYRVYNDGKLEWGDGAAAPDLSMARGGPGTFLFSGPGDELQAFFQGKDGTGVGNVLVDVGDAYSNVIVNAPTGDAAVWLNSSFIQDTAEHGIIEVSGNGFGATGTGLKVHSPNGTAYRLTVSNAGAVVVTAL